MLCIETMKTFSGRNVMKNPQFDSNFVRYREHLEATFQQQVKRHDACADESAERTKTSARNCMDRVSKFIARASFYPGCARGVVHQLQ